MLNCKVFDNISTNILRKIKNISLDTFSSLLMICLSVLAITLYNSNLYNIYNTIANDTLIYVTNEILMCIFFLFIGMELKKTFYEKNILKDKSYLLTTIFSTLGGMIVPAIIFLIINANNKKMHIGFGIPCATDIAFSIATFNLFAKHICTSLAKTFLLSISIFDDIGSIILIATCYNNKISYKYIPILIAYVLLILICNKKEKNNLATYGFNFAGLWILIKLIGIHTTISGVLMAILLPYKNNTLIFNKLLNVLNYLSGIVVLPLFAFLSCNIDLSKIDINSIARPAILGVVLGLFLGKQIGIVIFSKIANYIVFFKRKKLLTFTEIYLVSVISGIGFSMGLFIASLAFKDNNKILSDVKTGLILASLLSILWCIIIVGLTKLYRNLKAQ